jgi:8-oxo-dGTP pyrophosphatase MutT (NUDIX family)
MKKSLYRALTCLRRINPFRPRVTVGARAIVLEGARVLLVRHSYIDGWYLPGGGVERGETCAEAVRRELREEAGIEAREARLFGLYLAGPGPGSAARDDHVALYVVEAFTKSVAPKVDPEIAETAFFPLDALPVSPAGEPLASPATRRRLRDLAAGRPESERW